MTRRARPAQPLVNDYDSKVANAIHHFWADLLAKKKEHAAAAVKWSFVDRGREADMLSATTAVEKEMVRRITKIEKATRVEM